MSGLEKEKETVEIIFQLSKRETDTLREVFKSTMATKNFASEGKLCIVVAQKNIQDLSFLLNRITIMLD